MADDFGKTLASWQITGFERYRRSIEWYILYVVLGVVLVSIAIYTFNYLFVVVLVLLGFIIYMQASSDPHKFKFEITSKGIRIGNIKYPFKEIKQFWILYEPPEVKKLYFSFKQLILPRLMIPLKGQNPIKIRKLLLQFLEEDLDREDEPISEVVGRLGKL